jgi:regulator of protease activity HflC (stomatin/prohibitin superfamily)
MAGFSDAEKQQPSYGTYDVPPGQRGMLSESSTQLRRIVSGNEDDESHQSSENKSMLRVGDCYNFFCCCSGKHLVTVQAGNVGVVLRFGRYHKVLPSGRHRINMMADTVTKVSTSRSVISVPKQMCLTKENLSVGIEAALYYRVLDGAQALFAVDDFKSALKNLGLVTMRTVIGEFSLEYLFSKRDEINKRIKEVCSEQAATWGIEIHEITLLGVTLPSDLQQNMAAVAQSQRDAEASYVRADADKEVAKLNAEAAKIIQSTPAALDLKWMETLKAMAAGPARTIIVPPGAMPPPVIMPHRG